MTKTTIASLQKDLAKAIAMVNAQNDAIKKMSTTTKATKAVSGKIFLSKSFQTLAGDYKKSVSLLPMNDKYPNPACHIGTTFPATKIGFDSARALLDIAENKLEESGLLTQ